MLLLMGPTDAGKTTLAQELLAKAKEAYLLDLDPGQGALPGTFSLFLHREGRLLLVRRTLLGTLSPAGAEAKALVAALRLARLIPQGSPAVADTDGLLDPGYRLLQVDALNPVEVAVLGAEELYRALAWRKDLRVRLLPPFPGVRRKTPAERRRNRLERLLAHFREAGPRLAPLEGPPLPERLYGLLDPEGFFLGYGRLLASWGGEGLFLTPAKGEVAKALPTRLGLPSPALPG
ncbi:mRNA cleavage and polyadenylation factor CLP1 P-loop [Thermus arciformis]|uniref:mRNA cleavage and polyadenylation factor CLP1 P-loop n=1 Tax=Thermus arciformis TaxID=482827 RepID=A0A1G7IS64_9DEIN|nr:Clp1/GlmU family protein [Thermus arciformis]SDF15416.1 mRNA cleavage and polyadenylation factor CLP1 P-loop [Thermus arciformis]